MRLLADCRDVLALQQRAVVPSKDLDRLLRGVEGAPYAVFRPRRPGPGAGLRPYGIHSDRIRPNGLRQVRGYRAR